MAGHTEETRPLLARSHAASSVISAIDSEIRVSILSLLVEREYLVSEIVTQLGRPQPLISQHLRVLKNAGIVVSHPQGRSRCYKLSTPELHDFFRDIITLSATAHAHLLKPVAEIDLADTAQQDLDTAPPAPATPV